MIIAVLLAASVNPMQAQEQDRPRLLLISFDGFRYDYLGRAETPNFDRFIEGGVQSEGLMPVFPTKTFPNHYAIVTGLYPENSGIIANTMYDPEWERWYRIGDREAVEDPRWYQGEPIWNTAEKQGVTTGTMFWIGSEAPIQGMRPTYWKRYYGSMPERARIDTVVSWFTREKNPVDLATLYFELVDDAGHDYGLYSDSLDAAIRKSDRLLGYLKQRLTEADLWDAVNILIVSDHGMVELSEQRIIVLDEIIDLDKVERIVWDPVTMIQPEKGSEELLYRRLKRAENHYRIYRKEDLPEKYHLKNHRRVPDLLMIAEPGYAIIDRSYRSRFLERLPAADHGYDNHSEKMQAFFAARGPAVVSGKRMERIEVVDLYELMCRIMNIVPAPNDGSMDGLRMLLTE